MKNISNQEPGRATSPRRGSSVSPGRVLLSLIAAVAALALAVIVLLALGVLPLDKQSLNGRLNGGQRAEPEPIDPDSIEAEPGVYEGQLITPGIGDFRPTVGFAGPALGEAERAIPVSFQEDGRFLFRSDAPLPLAFWARIEDRVATYSIIEPGEQGPIEMSPGLPMILAPIDEQTGEPLSGAVWVNNEGHAFAFPESGRLDVLTPLDGRTEIDAPGYASGFVYAGNEVEKAGGAPLPSPFPVPMKPIDPEPRAKYVDAQTGEPLAGLIVSAGYRRGADLNTYRTDADGFLSPISYSVFMWRYRLGDREMALKATSSAKDDDGDIKVFHMAFETRPPYSEEPTEIAYRVRITDERDRPIENAHAVLAYPNGYRKVYPADENGELIAVIAGRTYDRFVRFAAPGYAEIHRSLSNLRELFDRSELAYKTVPIRLPPGGAGEVRIVDPAGTPLAGYRMRLEFDVSFDDYPLGAPPASSVYVSDENGYIRSDGFPEKANVSISEKDGLTTRKYRSLSLSGGSREIVFDHGHDIEIRFLTRNDLFFEARLHILQETVSEERTLALVDGVAKEEGLPSDCAIGVEIDGEFVYVGILPRDLPSDNVLRIPAPTSVKAPSQTDKLVKEILDRQ